jgi:hypothetical protein
MIDYADHAQWYAADPKAREHVQDVLATQGGAGGADRFRSYLYLGHPSFAAMRLTRCLDKLLPWPEYLTLLRIMQQVCGMR